MIERKAHYPDGRQPYSKQVLAVSIQVINEVKRRTIPGGQKAKHVLLHLADYCNADWTCWPSAERIAAETQIPLRTLARVMSGLRDAGVISTERRQVGQVRLSDAITLVHGALVELPLAGVDGPEHATLAPAEMASSDSEHAISDTENMPFRAESAEHSSIENHHKNHHVDSPDPVTGVTPSRTTTPDRYDDPDFTYWWALYPRKDEKYPAWRKWLSVRKTTPAEHIIEGCRRYAASIEALHTERHFIKLPATWLNKRCWEDEHPISLPKHRSERTIEGTVDSLSAALKIVNGRAG